MALGALLTMTVGFAAAGDWPNIDKQLALPNASAPGDAAVVIGIEEYAFLTDAPFAERDADVFEEFLLYTRGVPQDRVAQLRYPDASSAAIRAAVEEMGALVQPGDTLWIYFAGHGVAAPDNGERLLLGDSVKAKAEEIRAGAVPLEELKGLARGATEGDIVVLVDACYNGDSRGGEQLFSERFAFPLSYASTPAPSLVEWTATGPSQLASPLYEPEHGAFTYFAVGALRGWADGAIGQPDGVVTLEEADAYVEDALKAVKIRGQTPSLVSSDPQRPIVSGGAALESAPSLSGLDGSYNPTLLGPPRWTGWAAIGGATAAAVGGGLFGYGLGYYQIEEGNGAVQETVEDEDWFGRFLAGRWAGGGTLMVGGVTSISLSAFQEKRSLPSTVLLSAGGAALSAGGVFLGQGIGWSDYQNDLDVSDDRYSSGKPIIGGSALIMSGATAVLLGHLRDRGGR